MQKIKAFITGKWQGKKGKGKGKGKWKRKAKGKEEEKTEENKKKIIMWKVIRLNAG